MTRDEFIDYWIANAQLPAEWRLPDGVDFRRRAPGLVDCFSNQRWVALPCACNDESCRGWAMVPEDTAGHHMRFYAPEVPSNG